MRKLSVIRIFPLIAALLLCSSCNSGQVSSSVHSLPAESTTTSRAEITEDAVYTTASSVVQRTEKTTSASNTTKETTTVISTEISSSESTEPLTSETTKATTVLTSATTAATTTAATASSATTTSAVSEKTKTEIISETSVPAAQKPPAEIRFSSVSSPGTLKEDTETAQIDYSNASCGYISALYSGSSPRAKLRITCGGITCDHDLSVTGEKEYFPLMQGSGEYRIQIYEQYDGKMYMSVLDLSVGVEIDDDVKMYLYPNKYSMFDEKSDCVLKSAELCGGAEDDIEKIAAIFGYITDNVTYDYDLAASVQSGYIPDPDKVLKVKKGICFDYASLFAAMCRSQGIPTRLVIGYAADDIYHAWNEVYTKETGWIAPELLLKNKGYNIVDATFYASAENKEYIAGYISDSGNYSSVYRY